MDYCSTCRRNLNGALVCPGCGAYAPDIAPVGARPHGGFADTGTARQAWRPQEFPASDPYFGTRHAGAAPTGLSAFDDTEEQAGPAASRTDSDDGDGLDGTASTGQGRAARRRQLARWKKNRRRALAATAVALVGGGLTVAALPSGKPSTSHAHAAPPPEPVTAETSRTVPTGSSTEQPDTTGARHPGSRPPTTTGRQQNATGVTPPSAAATSRQQDTGATVLPTAPAGTGQHTTPSPAQGTHAGNAEAPAAVTTPAPETTAPAGSDDAPGTGTGTGTPILGILPTSPPGQPSSPVQVCLIGVCIG
ncbi:hypothetical protein ACIQMR_05595 [Streptomyces sp. NPDC091376]|uniref:SCO2400 family protein n=1 Tax=Streptomyces sp. NPDC091376 TaxID=3365994 RepID=UPI00383041B5